MEPTSDISSYQQPGLRCGYFMASIGSNGERLLNFNTDRAFVISQLQDILCLRSLLEDPLSHKRLAAHIDLLSYSVSLYKIQFVAFSISKQSVEELQKILIHRIKQYKSDKPIFYGKASMPCISSSLQWLQGPHDALQKTLAMHVSHKDWEYDRYSSIGFYLHDRRGDWMRIWRISNLYDNDPATYRLFMQQQINNSVINGLPVRQVY